MKLNEKLYDLRRKERLSQEQLAEKLNVSRQAISKWETGDNKPDLDNLKKIAQIFNVKIEYLINDESFEENQLTAEKKHGNNKMIVLLLIVSLLCFGLGYFVGNRKNDNEMIAQLFNAPKAITNFDSPYTSTQFQRTLETIPNFYHPSLKAEYIVVDELEQTKVNYPAHYDGRAFVSEKISFNPQQYSIYISFTSGNLEKTILLTDDFLVGQDISFWTNLWDTK